MYIGTQYAARHETDIQQLAQLGVKYVDVSPQESWQEWSVDLLIALREKYAKYGITVEMVHLPIISPNRGIPRVFLGPSPECDREIDSICKIIQMASEAGLRGINYNHYNIIVNVGNLRTESQYGRGAAKLSSFDYNKLDHSLDHFYKGAADADTLWERIDYWLERVVPVANEYKIQLACHPQDPGIGHRNYRGIARVMGTVEGLKKFVSMHENPYHGLNFCQGTISEMLLHPANEIYDIIRYFGERKKIFNIHFRNIKGGFLNFTEVFPDEGEVDMLKALSLYKELGYSYMVMPDHVPQISGDEADQVGFAYCYGYLHALMQAIDAVS